MKQAKLIAVMFFVLAIATIAAGLMEPQIFLRRAMDVYLHDTYYVVGNTVVFLVLGLFFGACGFVYLIYEKATRKTISSRLGHVHFWLSLCSIILFVFAFRGMPLGNPGDDAVLQSEMHRTVVLASAGFFGFLAAQIVFGVNVVWSFFRSKNA